MKRTVFICMLIAFVSYIAAALITGICISYHPELADVSYGITGVLTGIFTGTGASLYSHFRSAVDSEYKKKVRIDSTDERLVSIRTSSGSLAWKITLPILCAYTVVLSLQKQRTQSYVLILIIGISLAVYAVSLLYLNNEK